MNRLASTTQPCWCAVPVGLFLMSETGWNGGGGLGQRRSIPFIADVIRYFPTYYPDDEPGTCSSATGLCVRADGGMFTTTWVRADGTGSRGAARAHAL